MAKVTMKIEYSEEEKLNSMYLKDSSITQEVDWSASMDDYHDVYILFLKVLTFHTEQLEKDLGKRE